MSDASPDPAQAGQTEDNPAAGQPRGEAGTAQDQLAEAIRQRDDYLDQLQRSRAEFANYQKRARAQADADRMYAITGLAGDLLHVLDNLERARDAAKSSGAGSIVEGVDMVYRQALDVLARHGVQPIEALGQPFDPQFHEAITQLPSDEYPEGSVARELGRGYRIHDRVLRPTKVAVSTGRPS